MLEVSADLLAVELSLELGELLADLSGVLDGLALVPDGVELLADLSGVLDGLALVPDGVELAADLSVELCEVLADLFSVIEPLGVEADLSIGREVSVRLVAPVDGARPTSARSHALTANAAAMAAAINVDFCVRNMIGLLFRFLFLKCLAPTTLGGGVGFAASAMHAMRAVCLLLMAAGVGRQPLFM